MSLKQIIRDKITELVVGLRELDSIVENRDVSRIFERFLQEERKGGVMGHARSDARYLAMIERLGRRSRYELDFSPLMALTAVVFIAKVERDLVQGKQQDAVKSLLVAANYCGIAKGLSAGTRVRSEYITPSETRHISSKSAKSRAIKRWSRPERLEAIAKTREDFAKWQAGELKLPNAKPNSHLFDDFDQYAAHQHKVSARTIYRWRTAK